MFSILLNNNLSKSIISKVITKVIKNKIGRELDLSINELDIHDNKDDSVNIKIDANV